MAAGNLFRTLGPSLNLGIQLGLRSADEARADAREERLAKLQESQAIAASLQTWMKIDEIADPKLRNHLFGLYAERQRTPSGQQIFSPETVQAYQKMGDESREQVMQVLQANKELLVGMNPEQLATMFRDPLKAYEFIGKMAKVSGEQQQALDAQREREAYGMIETGGDLNARLASVDLAMKHARSPEGLQRLTTLRNSLLTEAENLSQARRAQEQTALARANLGVSRANLGLRQQELGMARSTNPAERYAAEMFGGQRFAQLAPEQQAAVNRRVEEQAMTLARVQGQARADVALENLRYTPQQQTQLQSLNDTLTSAEALREFSDEQITKWVGILRNPVERARQLINPDPEFLEFQTTVDQLKAAMLFSRTEGGGGALTETELRALQGFVPTGSETGGPAQFRAKVDQITRRLTSKLATVEGLGKAKPGEASEILKQRRQESAQARQAASALRTFGTTQPTEKSIDELTPEELRKLQ